MEQNSFICIKIIGYLPKGANPIGVDPGGCQAERLGDVAEATDPNGAANQEQDSEQLFAGVEGFGFNLLSLGRRF